MSNWSRIRRFSLRRQSKSQAVVRDSEVAEETTPILEVPETQTVLLLHGPKQQYELTEGYAVPKVESEHDVLVKVQVIGLNPIDWKAP